MRDILKILFDRGEHLFITPSTDKKGRLYTLETVNDSLSGFIAANAFKPTADTRSRENLLCGSLRTFVFEFDTGSLEMQKEIWKITKLPVSYVLWTGGKSLHHVITVDEVFTVENYLKAVTYFKKYFSEILPDISPDWSVLRPEVLTRLPGTVHHKTGTKSEIIELNGRVSGQTIADICVNSKYKPSSEAKAKHSKPVGKGFMSFTTRKFFETELQEGERHYQLLRAAKDSALRDVDMKYFLDKCVEKFGYEFMFEGRQEARTVIYAYEEKSITLKEASLWYNKVSRRDTCQ